MGLFGRFFCFSYDRDFECYDGKILLLRFLQSKESTICSLIDALPCFSVYVQHETKTDYYSILLSLLIVLGIAAFFWPSTEWELPACCSAPPDWIRSPSNRSLRCGLRAFAPLSLLQWKGGNRLSNRKNFLRKGQPSILKNEIAVWETAIFWKSFWSIPIHLLQ